MRLGVEKLVLCKQTTTQTAQRMNSHSNARLTQRSRASLVALIEDKGVTLKAAAAAFKVSERTARKWIKRYRVEGMAGLRDRSSRPHRCPRRTPAAQLAVVLSLRTEHYLPAFQIARATGLSKATVSRLLRRHKINRIGSLIPPPPVVRYQREHPGELIHFDIKKLGRFSRPGARMTGDPHDYTQGAGYEFVHVAIDDATRLAFAQILPDESTQSALAFLHAALSYFHSLGIKTQALMSDNGGCYRARLFGSTCRALGLRHIFTRPYTPRTNGKAERFIQTSLREWAYARTYPNSLVRAAHLKPWLHRYNWHRPHHSLHLQPPISKLTQNQNNLLRLHTYHSFPTFAGCLVWRSPYRDERC
jgi:transposase InsO family protein